MKCPTINHLFDYTRNLLSEKDKVLVRTHLEKGCGNCRESLQWLEEVGRIAREDRSFLLREETVKGMVAWFKSQPIPVAGPLRTFVASLLFDSLRPMREVAVRGEAASGQQAAGRQMLFQAEGYDIDLRFEVLEDQGAEDLLGQVVSQTEPVAATNGVTVCLSQNENLKMTTLTDSQGFFRFAGISSGIYDLKIEVHDGEIKLIKVPTACGN